MEDVWMAEVKDEEQEDGVCFRVRICYRLVVTRSSIDNDQFWPQICTLLATNFVLYDTIMTMVQRVR